MQTAPAGGGDATGAGGGDATGTGGGDATGTGGGDATGTGGGDATTAGGGLDTDSVPVSRNGDSTLPTLPLMLNTSVSVSVAVALPVKKVKLSVSPALSAYVVIWNSALPAYGPNGGDEGVSCKPRTAVPTYAVSVPDDCGVVPSVTKAVTAIVFAKSLGLKSIGGGDDMGGVDDPTPGGGDTTIGGGDGTGGGGDGCGGGGDGRGLAANGGGGEAAEAGGGEAADTHEQPGALQSGQLGRKEPPQLELNQLASTSSQGKP